MYPLYPVLDLKIKASNVSLYYKGGGGKKRVFDTIGVPVDFFLGIVSNILRRFGCSPSDEGTSLFLNDQPIH